MLTFCLTTQAADKQSSYIIKQGDTLSSIAEKTGIGYSRMADIAAANNIDNMDLIFPGQVIELGDFIIADTGTKAESTQEEQAEPIPDAQASPELKTPEQEESQSEEIETEKATSPTDQETDAEDEQIAIEPEPEPEPEPASIETDKKAKKYSWNFEPNFAAGFSIGQSFLDVETDRFEVSNQTINLDIDDSSLNLALFIMMSLSKDFGMELALNHLGVFEFTGAIGEPVQLGTSQGEQKIQAISLSAYYNKAFQHFGARVNAGIMQTRHQTSGEIDLVGSAAESIDYSENSSNPFIALEASRQIYENWSLGPRLTWVGSGDPIQSISIRLFRPIE